MSDVVIVTDPQTPATEAGRKSHDADCPVPGLHHHRPPTKAEIEQSRYTITIKHPIYCSWMLDVYDPCSCGVTDAVMALQDLMDWPPDRLKVKR